MDEVFRGGKKGIKGMWMRNLGKVNRGKQGKWGRWARYIGEVDKVYRGGGQGI